MANWREIMAKAESFKGQMISSPQAGEELFRQLLYNHPGDGMIYFKRGEAHEVLGKLPSALNDFERASILFPIERWKEEARTAVKRVKAKMDQMPTPNGSQLVVLSHTHLGEIYNSLRKLLNRIDKKKNPAEELHAQISRLEADQLIPSGIAVSMHSLRKFRNLAVKEQKQFIEYEAETIRSAWAAIKAWAQEEGYETKDLYGLGSPSLFK